MKTFRLWRPDAVLISDYDKGLLTPPFLRQVIDLCTLMGIVCVADAKRDPSLYEGAIIKGNQDYFGITGIPERVRRLDTRAVTTLGAYSPIVWDRGDCWSPVVRWQSISLNCVNHVGAGDCFAAHLTLGLSCGLSLKEAAAVAHSAGRVYVQRKYNEPPGIEEMKKDVTSW